MKKLLDYLLHDKTRELVRASVREKLLTEFQDESLQAADSAVRVVYDSILEEIVSHTESWDLTKANYVDAVKLIADKCLKSARSLMASIPQTHIVEREFRRDESIY